MALDPLIVDPTEAQQLVLDAVAGIYMRYRKWPVWAWLEETLERKKLDARTVVASMPTEPTYNYGFLRPTLRTWPRPQDQIGLRMAGLRHVQMAKELVEEFCALVGVLGTLRSNVRLDPFASESPVATRRGIADLMRPRMLPGPYLLDFLSVEPATWHCEVRGDPNGEEWVIELSPQVRRFSGIRTTNEYFDALSSFLVPSSDTDQSSAPLSHFSLPNSLDYLDTVWRLRFRDPLISAPGIERSARLAFAVTSTEEFDSAISAVAEVLKGLRVPGSPGVDGHPLHRMVPFLKGHLPPETIPRVTEAVERLDAARTIRTGVQHVGAQARAVRAYSVLGLGYPVRDWAAAWNKVQGTVAHALDMIREELQASDGE